MLLSPDQVIASLVAKIGISLETLAIIFLLLALWSIAWKGMALWKSAQRKEKWWFIALMIINTLGILEILYLFVFSKKGEAPPSPKI
ncbi:MAG: DUF5652 family protein [Patescibacteria group bacterium]